MKFVTQSDKMYNEKQTFTNSYQLYYENKSDCLFIKHFI